MRRFDQVPWSERAPDVRGIIAVLTVLVALAIPLTVEAHGKKAVPSDPVLFEQYQSGLAAYLKRDYVAALAAWRPLAERERESSAAQLFLGFMHANGLGLTRDPATAAEWYRRAAEQDNMLAQIRLGMLYRRGEGVQQDRARAYLWPALAARDEKHLGKLADALQRDLRTRMTSAQVAEAKRLTREWLDRQKKID
jgi:TPR repeat protein